MHVKTNFQGRERNYTLIWDKEDVNNYLSGCPDPDHIIVKVPNDQVWFHIFPKVGKQISEAFELMPDNASFYINLGIACPLLKQNATKKDFEKGDKIREENLENAINNAKRIPMRIYTTEGKPLNVGYVSMEINRT